jgi:hypothetical protein
MLQNTFEEHIIHFFPGETEEYRDKPSQDVRGPNRVSNRTHSEFTGTPC